MRVRFRAPNTHPVPQGLKSVRLDALGLGTQSSVSDEGRPRVLRSPWFRWGLLTFGLAFPLLPPVVGAVMAAANGGRPLVGAMFGGIATFVLLGFAWIGLGIFGAKREISVWRTARGK